MPKQQYSSNAIFLNKNLIIAWNHFKTAILIRSPWNEKEGIWFPVKMVDFKRSYSSKYMSVVIKYNEFYRIYRYKGFSICEIREIRGGTLIEGYQELKKNNTQRFNTVEKDAKSIWTADNLQEPFNYDWDDQHGKTKY